MHICYKAIPTNHVLRITFPSTGPEMMRAGTFSDNSTQNLTSQVTWASMVTIQDAAGRTIATDSSVRGVE